MALRSFLANRPPRPNPPADAASREAAFFASRPPPVHDWVIERCPTDDPAAGWSRVTGLRGTHAAMYAEVAAEGALLAEGDLVRASRLDRTWGTQWYVRASRRLLHLSDCPGGDARRTDLARDALGADWAAWWALPDGEVLVDMAQGMSVPDALLKPLAHAMILAAVERLLPALPAARQAPLLAAARELAAGPLADRTDFGLRVIDACRGVTDEAAPEAWLWGAISSCAVTVNNLCVTLATLVRAFAAGRPPEEARAAADAERARQAAMVRARLPLRAVMEAAADAAWDDD